MFQLKTALDIHFRRPTTNNHSEDTSQQRPKADAVGPVIESVWYFDEQIRSDTIRIPHIDEHLPYPDVALMSTADYCHLLDVTAHFCGSRTLRTIPDYPLYQQVKQKFYRLKFVRVRQQAAAGGLLAPQCQPRMYLAGANRLVIPGIHYPHVYYDDIDMVVPLPYLFRPPVGVPIFRPNNLI